ncbi:MAG: hypothetical protein HOV79_18275 [Hamadaea sp.]|nr:hypothetical protein [Hamadaea sp.]
MPDTSAVTRSAYDVIAPAFARAQSLGYPELLDDMHAFAAGLAPGAVAPPSAAGSRTTVGRV